MKEVEPNRSNGSFVIKCLLKTVRFMWQVTEIPSKIGETISTLYRYAQDSVDIFMCVAGKARRKERDGEQNSTDTKLYLEESVLERKLPEADLKALVDLPAGLDYNEWLASHTLALFEHVNLVYGTISEFCTPTGCPDMTGPGNRTYLWFDEKGKKTRVAAPQYIDYVMTFTQKTVSDESIFPTKYANEFPGSFESIARKILRLQFHVIAHLYAAHFREIALLGLHTHLNLTFAHLTALHRRFNLIDEKETDVLRDLEVALRLTDTTATNTANTNTGNTATTTTTDPQTDHQTVGGAAVGGVGVGVGVGAGGASTHAVSTQSTAAVTSMDDVNLQQQQIAAGTTTVMGGGLGSAIIDGDAAATPICTQPEASTRAPPALVFGGGSGLIGGILGDLAGGEFADANSYCHATDPVAAAAAANCAGNGAGALHLNFASNQTGGSSNALAASSSSNNNKSNTNNNNHAHPQQQAHSTQPYYTHHTHHHNHHLHHHHNHHHHHNNHYTHNHQLQHPQPNSGLIQCNPSIAPSAAAAAATSPSPSASSTTSVSSANANANASAAAAAAASASAAAFASSERMTPAAAAAAASSAAAATATTATTSA